jgi:hypothetical protein
MTASFPETQSAWSRLKENLRGLRRDRARNQIYRGAACLLDTDPNPEQRAQAYIIIQAVRAILDEEMKRLAAQESSR